MGAQVSFILLKNFRHHHLEHQTPLKSKELPFEIMWSKDLMFFKKQSARKIEKTYKDNGWQVVQKTNLGTDILLLMEKDHEQILINNEMGVKL
ncbi:MAG: hypothetical protein SGI74_01225 [Oligoflexia bacterium]|nr:hypothetical protein [Oligoflexia bacterium]